MAHIECIIRKRVNKWTVARQIDAFRKSVVKDAFSGKINQKNLVEPVHACTVKFKGTIMCEYDAFEPMLIEAKPGKYTIINFNDSLAQSNAKCATQD